MRTTHTILLTGIALILLATTAQASDNARDIARQLQAHQQAEEQLLHALAVGDEAQISSAAIDIATSETYLQVSGFPGNDPRLLGALFQKNDSPNAFAVKVFHKRLNELTGFHIAPGDAFTQVNWNRVEGGMQ